MMRTEHLQKMVTMMRTMVLGVFMVADARVDVKRLC